MRISTSGRKVNLKGEFGDIVADALAESGDFPDDAVDKFLKSGAFMDMKQSLVETVKEHLEGVTE